MRLIGFSGSSYEFFDRGRHVMFSVDSRHTELFDYVENSSSLSQLPELLEEYFIKGVDLNSFELRDYCYSKTDTQKFEQILRPLHPYYEHEYQDVMVKSIGDQLNAQLAYLIYRTKTLNYTGDYARYAKVFTEITKPFSQSEEYSEIFYDKLNKWLMFDDQADQYADKFLYGIPNSQPIGFIQEIRTYNDIKSMLLWILDIDNCYVNTLTLPQRAWFYDNITFGAAGSMDIAVKKHLLLKPRRRYRKGDDDGQMADYEYIHKIYDLFEPLRELGKYESDNDNIPHDMLNSLNNAVEYARNIPNPEIYEEYEIEDLHQLLYLEVLKMIQTNTMIRKCRHCGKYFVITNRRTSYCSRIAEGETEPCDAIGSKRTFKKSMAEDYALKIYTRAYKTHYARRKGNNMTDEDFSLWCEAAKNKLGEVRRGELDIAVFEEWLKK